MDDEGNAYTYTFEDPKLPGYTMTMQKITNAENGINNFFTAVFTHEPVMYDIAVTKVWDDLSNADGLRPESVNVQILKNGVAAQTLTLDDSNNWTGFWNGQPKCSAGKEIAYAAAETDVPEDYSVHVSGSAAKGFVITNTYRPEPETASLKITKVWDDMDNADGIRPESVTIRLMLNGKPQDQSLTLSAWNAWTDSFTILADTEGYHIEEDKVRGYSASISGDVRNGFIVTNKHVPAVRNTSDLPQTGDHFRMALWMTLCAASLGALAMLCMKKRRTE